MPKPVFPNGNTLLALSSSHGDEVQGLSPDLKALHIFHSLRPSIEEVWATLPEHERPPGTEKSSKLRTPTLSSGTASRHVREATLCLPVAGPLTANA